MSSRRARRGDLRAVPTALLAWAGAGLATTVPGAALPTAIVAGTLAAVALVLSRATLALSGAARGRGIRSRLRTLAAVIAVACAAAAAPAVHVLAAEPGRSAVAALEVDGGRAMTFHATVTGKVEAGAEGFRFDASLQGASYGDHERRLRAPIVVLCAATAPGLDVGAIVEIQGTAFRADPGDRAVLVVDAGELTVVAPAHGILAIAGSLRAGLRAVTADLPAPGGGLVPGLAVGDTGGVDADLDAAMKASSLSHLTAVSGANCALVVAIGFALAAWCRARRGLRVAAGLTVLAGFVLLVTPEPSVVRAAVMAAIAMLGVLLGRIGAGVSVLAVAVAGILIADPWLCGSLGFALSAVATGALLLLAAPLADGLARVLPAPLALALAVPLAAQLACGPLLILISPAVPLQGVLANLLAGPAAPAGTVLGLAACLLAGIPVLGLGVAALAWLPAAWIAGTATSFAGIPAVAWMPGLVGAITLTVVGAAVATLVIVPRGGRRRLRAGAAATVAATIGILLGTGPLAVIGERAVTPDEWTIAACEIGQGDAVLLRSAGRTMLVDTGPDPVLLAECLDRFDIDRVDVLVLTHFDLDHRGGIDAVRGRVGVMLHGPADAEGGRLLDEMAAAGAQPAPAAAGMTGTLGDARWRVLWPRAGGTTAPGNDASVVVDVAGPGLPATLLLGDLSASPQQALLSAGTLRAHYDVVKVAHHGSADQSDALYRAISPTVAIVTVGENDYGHPRASILSLLTSLGTTVARTDTDGDVLVWREGGQLTWWRRGPLVAAADVVGAG